MCFGATRNSVLSAGTGSLLGQGEQGAKSTFLAINTFEDLIEDTQPNVTEEVTHFNDKQPVRALTLSEPPLNVKISNRQSEFRNQHTF